MHPLVNKAFQSYICDCHGADIWTEVSALAGVPNDPLEIILHYKFDHTKSILETIARRIDIESHRILEDLGNYLVAHPRCENLRRLLRFGGQNFMDFLLFLPDMPSRARLAVPDLPLPSLHICHKKQPPSAQAQLVLTCDSDPIGWPYVLVGLVRAMADDYGTLATIEHDINAYGAHIITIKVIELGFSAPRHFDLRKPIRASSLPHEIAS